MVANRPCRPPAVLRLRGESLGLWLVLLCCTWLLAGCSVGYLWHVTVGQARLLARQQPVAEVLRDGRLSAQERQKIRLILDAKSFAVTRLGLHESDSYTTFVRVAGPYVSYNLSAAPKDALRPYVWHFPIIGKVPYKGFFNKAYAMREQRKLAAQGYDTYVRGVRAFSTLGYFDDPILSCMLALPDFALINTVIHELVHQTVWIKGRVRFNESLANFVADHGTLAYLAWRYGQGSPEYRFYEAFRADKAVFEAYMQALIARLEALYRQPLSRAEKLHRRQRLFAQAKANYAMVLPRLQTPYYRQFFVYRPLNNAVLLSFRRYHHYRDIFARMLAAHDGDLRRMLATLKAMSSDQLPVVMQREP